MRHAFVHTSRRALERYGVTLSLADYHALVAQVRENRARWVARQSAGRTIWIVQLRGVDMKAVYQSRVGILTVLSPDMVTRAEVERAVMLEEG